MKSTSLAEDSNAEEVDIEDSSKDKKRQKMSSDFESASFNKVPPSLSYTNSNLRFSFCLSS